MNPGGLQKRCSTDSRRRSPTGVLKTYKGFPHGMLTTQAETINADILAFIKSS
jgi:non-heme chloroperoxidase